MIFEMVNERLIALANKWSDLGDAFRRLAASLPTTDQRRLRFGEANVDLADPTRQEKGLQRLCFHKRLIGVPGIPNEPVEDRGESQRLDDERVLLDPADPLVTAPPAAPGTINRVLQLYQ